jgi:hypothetical protein
MKSDRIIKVDSTGKRGLMKVFDVGERAVEKALSYDSNSELAKRIRVAAVKEFGGVIWEATAKDWKWV